MENNKEQLTAAWPETGMHNQTALIFSGSFSSSRLRDEALGHRFKKISEILTAVFIMLGAAGLIFSAWLSWADKNWLFILSHNFFNLAFYIGCLFALYFWAKIKQKQLNGQKLNLLLWDNADAIKNQPPEIDVYQFFNEEAKECWRNAAKFGAEAKPHGAEKELRVTAVHLMLSLLENKNIQTLFYRLGADFADLKQFLNNYSRLVQNGGTDELWQIPFAAFREAIKLGNKTIDPLMLLCALKIELPENHVLQGVFLNLDISQEDLEIACGWIFNLELLREQVKNAFNLSRFRPGPQTNRGLTSIPTPYLNRFSRDLTEAARYRSLPLAFGRNRDLAEIFKLLDSEKKSLLIKGPTGTGRTTVINALAYRMAAEQVPEALSDKRLVELETAAILSNQQKAEQILIKALDEAAYSGNIIIYISNLHELARVQTFTGISLLEVLTDYLKNSNLTLLGSSTNEDYTDYLRKLPEFDSIFSSYELKVLSRTEILLASCIQASLLEYHNKCLFSYPAVKHAMELTDLYIKDGGQPQKTIAILIEAASRIKSQKRRIVDTELIETIVSDKTHIPAQTLNRDESEKLLNLEAELAKYIIGQQDALVAVAEGLRRARSGLNSENRPLASFLFLGPTGVGKTEVARTLAKTYFGEEKFLLRLDMSEYQGQDGLIKLLGAENSKTDSPMVKHLKNYPFCLLLLDEFEKASPQVLNLFLQVLEDGRLTSGRGETIDLTHCLIISTSNAGSAEIRTGIKAGKNLDHIKAKLLDESLLKYYPPELLNRFDGVIIFSPLSPDEVAAIVYLRLGELKQQMLAKGIKVEFSAAVAQEIAEKAYDPSLGARPVRRYIQDHVETFIAKLLLQKSVKRGSEINIDTENGKLIIAK